MNPPSFFAQELVRLADAHTSATVPISNRRGMKLAHSPPEAESYRRLCRIMEWLIIWRTPGDQIAGAFLANGIKPHRRTYFTEIHLRLRSACGNKDTFPRFRNIARARELHSMGATFAEIYLMYWGEELRAAPQSRAYRRNLLQKIIQGAPT
jgi:hypothetical protein